MTAPLDETKALSATPPAGSGGMLEYDPNNPGGAFFALHFMAEVKQLSPEAQCKAMEFIGENRRLDERTRLHAAWAQLQAEVGQVEPKGQREGGIKYPRWQDVHDAIHPCLTRLGAGGFL